MDELLISTAGGGQRGNRTAPQGENFGQPVSGGKGDGEHSGGAFPVMVQGNLCSVRAEQPLSGKQTEAEVFFVCPCLRQGRVPLRIGTAQTDAPLRAFQ